MTKKEPAWHSFGKPATSGALIVASDGGLAIPGWAIAAPFATHFAAGLHKIFTGQDTDSLASQDLQKFGVSREAANFTDYMVSIPTTMWGVAAARAGQVALFFQGGRFVKTTPNFSSSSMF